LTDEQIRIAIAEACGWMDCRFWRGNRNDDPVGTAPDGGINTILPDYPNDLNAMHEAEKALDINLDTPDSPRYRYSHFLYAICRPEQQPFRATARQRAEAFLRTLNLWKP
jgi:hypothetical protein